MYVIVIFIGLVLGCGGLVINFMIKKLFSVVDEPSTIKSMMMIAINARTSMGKLILDLSL